VLIFTVAFNASHDKVIWLYLASLQACYLGYDLLYLGSTVAKVLYS